MTSHAGRLYALALALVVFFLTWSVIAARPWSRAAADPRLAGLRAREARLRKEARLVDRIVAARWAAYHRALQARRTAARAATFSTPAVRVVTLPPLTITRTS